MRTDLINMASEDDLQKSNSATYLMSLSYQRNVMRNHRKKAAAAHPVSRLAARRQTMLGPQSIVLPAHLQHLQGEDNSESKLDETTLKRLDSMRSAHAYQAHDINKHEDEEEEELEVRRNKILGDAGFLRHQLYDLTESPLFTGFILCVILFNAFMLCALTFSVIKVRAEWHFKLIDYILLVIYFMECAIKIYVWRWDFFKEMWNIMDFLIVISNVADFGIEIFYGGEVQILAILSIFRAMRALKALRVLKTVRFLRSLQVIMNTCLESVQSMGAIIMLISLFLYIFAVIGRGLYADIDKERFGNIGSAALTLFQLLTLDDWFYIYSDAVARDPNNFHIIFYLITYIALEYFIFLNLFVAVLVDNFQLTLDAASERDALRKAALKEAEDALFDDGIHTHPLAPKPTLSSLSNAHIKMKTIDDYYDEEDYSTSEKKYLSHFLQLLASIEHNGHILRNQQGTLDKVVLLVQDTVDDA
ncbi:cation channel sperm-associated protein 1 [Strongylocentrotus purpuratus]|uniref:Ion transport domain-containing protein n=1 Tax=Strongylocentrotus purpuratus TaxID=7668 RepID=A0A7M7PSM4_STRPU|nr:cation channel sperm-associated protein 1 [Strongylocentrotus purpuratus]XP_030854943.1 cation channel sperm-associated protein 1 [Strongylocentrotus purpuratus]XP_030854944.1 cation channel sperm-associated protein 1 [Strongylocentrotus purpuratus]|eukprot:XP_011664201.1 PREDICTED: cation channel sperm-associated protein 1 [Strongylocentrotus purpuratus]